MTTQQIYTYEEAYGASLEYFNNDDLAAKVFIDKYALRDENNNILEKTPDDMHWRLAKEFARIEKKKFKEPLSKEEIYECFKNFKRIIPQGSPMYGIGNTHQYVSIGNCFVLPAPDDSYLGIMSTDTNITQISSRRGGIGFDISKLRPKETPVKNAAKSTTGAVEFMKRFSNTIREVGQAGRRAAGLMSISVHHPEVLDFITCKQDLTQVTGANISVKFTDEFLKAVENDEDFELRWPVCKEDAEEMRRPFPQISIKIKAKKIWDTFIDSTWKSSEPGAMFFDTVLRESTTAPYKEYGFIEESSNPCLSGETLVYTADGRGNIPIKALALADKDVDVFCINNHGNICVRKMRHPRKTGRKRIYKVLLDDGNSIRCTDNHKFMMSDGTYKTVNNLKNGDSLFITTKFEGSIKDIFPKANANSQDYIWLKNANRAAYKSEHRLIAEYNYGDIPKHSVVHHIDYNAQNNCPSNLRIMTKKDHDDLHAKNMIGDNNPMRRAHKEWSKEKWDRYRKNMSKATSGSKNGRFIDISNDELLDHAVKLTKKINRRFSAKEWQKYAKSMGIPQQFSEYRRQVFGSITDFAIKAATIAKVDNATYDPRLVKTHQRMINQGYTATINQNKVFVQRTCECCGNDFWTEHNTRESCFCSHKCVSNYLGNNEAVRQKISKSRNDYEDRNREIKGKQQIDIFLRLKKELNRTPYMKEWSAECKKYGIPCRIGKHSKFKTFSHLKDEASNVNHKVVSITEDGYEDVYNGTVDEFHNFLVGGFESKQANGKKKWHYLCNKQCGEQFLPRNTSCRLICINLYTYVDNKFTDKAEFNVKKFAKDVKIMQRLADDMVDLEIESIYRIIKKIKDDPEPDNVKAPGLTLWNNIVEYSKKDRRTGCGLTGLGDCLAALGMKYDSEEALLFCEQMQRLFKTSAYESSIEMAEELGPFPLYNKNLDIKSDFIKRFSQESPELYKRMTKSGRRNMTLLTIAPTGSVSCLTQTTSGIEPVFMLSYMRRKKGNPGDKDFRTDFVDQNGDNWMHFQVFHKGFKDWQEITGKTAIEDSPYHKSQAHELDYTKRVELQGKIQLNIDNSISVTTNLPESISKEEVSRIYLKAWKCGCKGMTIYRDGSRTGVLVQNTEEKKEDAIQKTNCPKRPKHTKCDIHHTTVKGKSYLVVVGLLGDDPYEVFASENGTLDKKFKAGEVIKQKRGKYQLVSDGNTLVDSLTENYNEYEEAMTRLVSTSLRHGADISFVVHQLEKSHGDIQSFNKAIARVLKKYIPDGTQVSGEACKECGANLQRKEGCVCCPSCGWSKC